jgi:hypothetical protein
MPKVTHALSETLIAGFGLGAGDLRFHLVEQGHQFAAQILPLAGIGLLIVLGIGADH